MCVLLVLVLFVLITKSSFTLFCYFIWYLCVDLSKSPLLERYYECTLCTIDMYSVHSKLYKMTKSA